MKEDYYNIASFLNPLNTREITGDNVYQDKQIGGQIQHYSEEFPNIEKADIILVGCGEQRGNGILGGYNAAPDLVRRQLYALYFWHEGIRIADVGDVKPGDSYNDTIAALRTVIEELITLNKTVIIIGGTHDLTMAQYGAYVAQKKIIEATITDAIIDLDMESPFLSDHFLMGMLTDEPNYIRQYNHLAFQSYFVHPGMLQTLDKLKFDFVRVGQVKEHIENMEPFIRNSELFSFDINAIAYPYAPANRLSPNGLNGEEACQLMQYAGMSSKTNTIGIYGYDATKDMEELTARQIAQMIWYMLDGRYKRQRESSLEERDHFNEYQLAFADIETVFLQSKKTGRWWMQLQDSSFIPCSYQDYLQASGGEIPDRWFRAHQR